MNHENHKKINDGWINCFVYSGRWGSYDTKNIIQKYKKVTVQHKNTKPRLRQ